MSAQRTHQVTFHPPALASQHLPIPITGAGALTYSPEHLEVQGAKVKSLGRNGVVVLGFFGGFVAIIAIGIIFGLQDHIEKLVAAGMALGVMLYGAFNRRPIKEGEPVTHRYTWAHTKRKPKAKDRVVFWASEAARCARQYSVLPAHRSSPSAPKDFRALSSL